jgi:aryl-alcohol dehydrogenase-like predicted oxidoreductase
MRYTTFGRLTGLRVSEYGLGTANFGTQWKSGADRDVSKRMFDRFAEAGGTLIDTADTYQVGESETLLADFLAAERDHFVVASKFTEGVAPLTGISETGNSRKTMVRAVEASLRRLQTDYLDLYWAHWPDSVTPVEEIVATFDVLVRSGKILHGGLSNFPAWRVARAVTVAEHRGWAPIIGVQTEYSLVERSAERELLPMAEGLGLGAALYSPLAGGLLTGKYRHSDEGRLSTWQAVIHSEDTDQKTIVVDAVLAIAAELEVTPSQVAVAWLRERAQRASTTLVPIIGPRTLAQLDDYLAALDVTLSSEQYERLDWVSAPTLGPPYDGAASRMDSMLGGDASSFIRPAAVP